MYYFAYGSNMSSRRLRQRLGRVSPLAVAILTRHRLCWHKQGRDGSGKCDAAPADDADDAVIGVLYELAAEDRPLLDRFEGVGAGYEAVDIRAMLLSGEFIEAFTYQATRIDKDAIPFCWYKSHVLHGAREHGLPADYIAGLESVVAQDDPDWERHRHELSIYASG